MHYGLPALRLGLHVLSELPGTLADADWLFPAERHWLQAQRWRRPDEPPAFADGLRRLAVWKPALVRLVVDVVDGGAAKQQSAARTAPLHC